MEITYPHSFSQQEAQERMAALGEYLSNKHGMNVSWNDDKTEGKIDGKYMIVKIDATLKVSEDKVLCTGKDPGRLWRKKASQYIEGKLKTYLDANTALEDLPRS